MMTFGGCALLIIGVDFAFPSIRTPMGHPDVSPALFYG